MIDMEKFGDFYLKDTKKKKKKIAWAKFICGCLKSGQGSFVHRCC